MSDPQDSGQENPSENPSETPFQADDGAAAPNGPSDNVVEGIEGGVSEAQASPVEQDSEDSGESEVAAEDPAALLVLAQAELKKAADDALRARAEMDNVRKRAARDTDNARKFALEKLMTDMLDVTESLERGLLAAQGEQVTVEQMVEGTDLTFKMLEKVLAKHGLESVAPENEPFDPERHEALSMIPTADCEPDTVVQVVQKGYMLNGRLLRPARVLVAKALDA